jgi:N,N'-diacetyllegionaminate synthase
MAQTLIVAEAAQGYEGDPSLARLLVRAAGAAGADLVKFQVVYADELAAPSYQHYALFRQLEMADEAWAGCAADAEKAGVGLAFDVYGMRSLAVARQLRAAAVKIHATDFFNDALVAAALESAPQVFLSAGGIEAAEIEAFFGRHPGVLAKGVLFYGFQAEPTGTADNNLRRLLALRQRFPELRLGFMDHTDGASDEAGWLSTLALPLGAVAIEKHLSLDRDLALEDYVSALGPEAFRAFVRRVRAAESALGTADLALTAAEKAYRRRAVKVVTAARALDPDQALASDDLALLRTALDEGRAPINELGRVLGRRLSRGVAAGGAIYEDDLL